MRTSSDVLPWILNVHSGIVAAFDFNASYFEVIIGAGIRTMPEGALVAGFVAGSSTICCGTAFQVRE